MNEIDDGRNSVDEELGLEEEDPEDDPDVQDIRWFWSTIMDIMITFNISKFEYNPNVQDILGLSLFRWKRWKQPL